MWVSRPVGTSARGPPDQRTAMPGKWLGLRIGRRPPLGHSLTFFFSPNGIGDMLTRSRKCGCRGNPAAPRKKGEGLGLPGLLLCFRSLYCQPG